MRVIEVDIDGETVKVSSLSWGASDRFATSGKELQAKGDAAQPNEWLDRMGAMVAESMTRAGKETKLEELKETFSLVEVRKLHDKILEISGLKAVELGEAAAAPTSASSAAA